MPTKKIKTVINYMIFNSKPSNGIPTSEKCVLGKCYLWSWSLNSQKCRQGRVKPVISDSDKFR